MRFAGQAGHQLPADLWRRPVFRRHVDVQLSLVEQLQILGGQPRHGPVNPKIRRQLVRHVFDDARPLAGLARSGWFDRHPSHFRLEPAQFHPVVNASSPSDVHPGQSGSWRPSASDVGRISGGRLVSRKRFGGSDKRVEQVAGDPRTEWASQPDIRRPFGVHAQHNVPAEQHPHLLRFQNRPHLHHIDLIQKIREENQLDDVKKKSGRSVWWRIFGRDSFFPVTAADAQMKYQNVPNRKEFVIPRRRVTKRPGRRETDASRPSAKKASCRDSLALSSLFGSLSSAFVFL